MDCCGGRWRWQWGRRCTTRSDARICQARANHKSRKTLGIRATKNVIQWNAIDIPQPVKSALGLVVELFAGDRAHALSVCMPASLVKINHFPLGLIRGLYSRAAVLMTGPRFTGF